MKRNFWQLLLCAVVLGFCSCSSDNDPAPREEKDKVENTEKTEDNEQPSQPTEKDIFSEKGLPSQPIRLTPQQISINEKLGQFSWSLLGKAVEMQKASEPNLLISPLSMTECLLMLCNGLGGETRQEVMDALGIGKVGMDEANAYIQAMREGLVLADNRSQYYAANSLWYNQALTPQTDFLSAITDFYKADIFPSSMDATTLKDINEWVNQTTFGRIPKLLNELPQGTLSILLNTIYFRGLWGLEIKKNDISEKTFHAEGGQQQTVTMGEIRVGDYTLYEENEAYQAATLRIGNGAYRMLFLLPREGVTKEAALEAFVSTEPWTKDFGKRSHLVDCTFPFYKTQSSQNVNELLMAMGIQKLFMSSEDVTLFNNPVPMDNVNQDATLTVNEYGVDGAAATYDMSLTMGNGDGVAPKYYPITLDRPFFYAIIENSTSTPLFMGYQGSIQ